MTLLVLIFRAISLMYTVGILCSHIIFQSNPAFYIPVNYITAVMYTLFKHSIIKIK